jgi:hypothetical protein
MTIEFEKLYTEAELTPERLALLKEEWEPAYGADDEAVEQLAETEGEPEPTEDDLKEIK